jgi:hypothetical protein
MNRFLALPLALAVGVLAPGPATAQTQDCVAAGLLTVDEVSYGTQRIPRDPRNPASREQTTLTVGIRNISTGQVSFTASFSAPPVQQDFLAGQRWTLSAGGRSTITVANVLRPGLPENVVRGYLRLSCG